MKTSIQFLKAFLLKEMEEKKMCPECYAPMEEGMCNECGYMEEDLVGGQKKLDIAPPFGKLTGADFKSLGNKKKGLEEKADMKKLEFEFNQLKKANPGKKITYDFIQDAPNGYVFYIDGKLVKKDHSEIKREGEYQTPKHKIIAQLMGPDHALARKPESEWNDKEHDLYNSLMKMSSETGKVPKINESEDHEVSMANNSLRSIISAASKLLDKMGSEEKDIPAWIQDHITNAENYIEQASKNYHEYEDGEEGEEEYEDELEDSSLAGIMNEMLNEAKKKKKKPSAGLTKKQKSTIVKKAKAGKDIGKKGKGFAAIEKKAKASGADNPKAVAAAAMWKGVKSRAKK